MGFKLSSGKWRPFCLGLNVLNSQQPKVSVRGPTAAVLAIVLPPLGEVGDLIQTSHWTLGYWMILTHLFVGDVAVIFKLQL